MSDALVTSRSWLTPIKRRKPSPRVEPGQWVRVQHRILPKGQTKRGSRLAFVESVFADGTIEITDWGKKRSLRGRFRGLHVIAPDMVSSIAQAPAGAPQWAPLRKTRV